LEWSEADPDGSALLPNQLYAHQDYGFALHKGSNVVLTTAARRQQRTIPPEQRYESADTERFCKPTDALIRTVDDNLYDRIDVLEDHFNDDEPSYEELLPYRSLQAGTVTTPHSITSHPMASLPMTSHLTTYRSMTSYPMMTGSLGKSLSADSREYRSLIVRSTSSSGAQKVEPVYAKVNKIGKRHRQESLHSRSDSTDRRRPPSVRRLQQELRHRRSHSKGRDERLLLPPVCGRSPPCSCARDEELAARLRIRILRQIASLRRRHIRLRVRVYCNVVLLLKKTNKKLPVKYRYSNISSRLQYN
jgi:hypothetical protein